MPTVALPEDDLRRWVFPLVATRPASKEPDGIEVEFRGTGFLLRGLDGLAVTARHVADELGESPAAMFVDDPQGTPAWHPTPIEIVDRHSIEDVAYLQIADGGDDRGSPLAFSGAQHHPTMKWMTVGYPTDVQYEKTGPEGRVLSTIDLVYAEGYVRRRVTDRDLPGLRGRRFSELSIPPGLGFSGAPMISRTLDELRGWPVLGVIVGQRYAQAEDIRVGYAARVEDDPWFRRSPDPLDL